MRIVDCHHLANTCSNVESCHCSCQHTGAPQQPPLGKFYFASSRKRRYEEQSPPPPTHPPLREEHLLQLALQHGLLTRRTQRVPAPVPPEQLEPARVTRGVPTRRLERLPDALPQHTHRGGGLATGRPRRRRPAPPLLRPERPAHHRPRIAARAAGISRQRGPGAAFPPSANRRTARLRGTPVVSLTTYAVLLRGDSPGRSVTVCLVIRVPRPQRAEVFVVEVPVFLRDQS